MFRRKSEREVFPGVDIGGDFDFINHDAGLGDRAAQMTFNSTLDNASGLGRTRS